MEVYGFFPRYFFRIWFSFWNYENPHLFPTHKNFGFIRRYLIERGYRCCIALCWTLWFLLCDQNALFFESVFYKHCWKVNFFSNNFEEIAQFKIRGSVTCLHFLKWYAKPCTQVKIQDSLIDFEGNFCSAVGLKNSPVPKIKTKKWYYGCFSNIGLRGKENEVR